MAGVPKDHILIGQVFHEDDDWLTLRIPKDMSKEITLGEAAENDKFFTLIFVHSVDDGRAMETWIPWEGD